MCYAAPMLNRISWTASALRFALLLLLPPSLAAQDAIKRDAHEMHRLHADPKAYIGALEDPKRDEYQKPHEVLSALKLRPGEVVADIGAGSGYFTFRLAHHVGAKGKVYAVDVSPDMIRHVNAFATRKRPMSFPFSPIPTIRFYRSDPSTASSSVTCGITWTIPRNTLPR